MVAPVGAETNNPYPLVTLVKAFPCIVRAVEEDIVVEAVVPIGAPAMFKVEALAKV